MQSDLHRALDTAPHTAASGPTVAVVGLGYVGLPVATTCARAGCRVIGIDRDPQRVHELEGAPRDGAVGPYTAAVRSGRLILTTDPTALAWADVVFLCVPTPREDGEAEHAAVRACAETFARHGRPDALVILESTVRPGFVEELRPVLGHGGRVALAYAPERIDPQLPASERPLWDIPRLVAGVDGPSQRRAATVLRMMGIAAHPVPLRVAEYAKLLENAYRLLNIAFIDELAELCRAEGISPHAVIQAAATKPFGYHAFWPGVGAGGHCIAVDPAFLAHRARTLGRPLGLLEGALQANARRPAQVAGSVAAETKPGDTVLVVGLTYKPGVADLRESAAVTAARALAGMNRHVLAFDSLVDPPQDLEAVSLDCGLSRACAVLLLVRQSAAVRARLATCSLPLFDATGTLPGALEV